MCVVDHMEIGVSIPVALITYLMHKHAKQVYDEQME